MSDKTALDKVIAYCRYNILGPCNELETCKAAEAELTTLREQAAQVGPLREALEKMINEAEDHQASGMYFPQYDHDEIMEYKETLVATRATPEVQMPAPESGPMDGVERKYQFDTKTKHRDTPEADDDNLSTT